MKRQMLPKPEGRIAPFAPLVLLSCLLIAVVAVACGDDDDDTSSGSSDEETADATDAASGDTGEIDLETFTVGETYTVDLQEMAGSGVTGTAVLTGVAEGDVSINVQVDGVSEGAVYLYEGVPSCPAETLPAVGAEIILDLKPLVDGMSETSPVGASTETSEGENLYVFSGPLGPHHPCRRGR